MEQQLTQLTNLVAQMTQANLQQQHQFTELMQQQQQQIQQLLAAQVQQRPQQEPGRMMEAKGLNKPKEFDGSENMWMDFAFKFENWLVATYHGAREILRWAEQEERTIDTDDGEIPTTMDAEERKVMNVNLYLALAQLVTGEALTILKNCEANNGLDAWRRLVRHYKPKAVG